MFSCVTANVTSGLAAISGEALEVESADPALVSEPREVSFAVFPEEDE